jgi:hypothetical protein
MLENNLKQTSVPKPIKLIDPKPTYGPLSLSRQNSNKIRMDIPVESSFKKIVFNLLKWALIIVLAIWVIFRYFLYIDIRSGCKVAIYPSWVQFNNHTVIKAIDFLKERYPENYAQFCKNVRTIDPNPVLDCGGIGGGCFLSKTSDTIYIGTYSDQLVMTAAVIAHETCHVEEYKRTGKTSEIECTKISDAINNNKK